MSLLLVVEEEISLVHGGIMAMSKVEIYKNGLALLFGMYSFNSEKVRLRWIVIELSKLLGKLVRSASQNSEEIISLRFTWTLGRRMYCCYATVFKERSKCLIQPD